MKDLSEEEILKRLLAKRENFKVTHEEVINPDYETWGRAREWHYHQGVCLFAGLAPVSKPYFDIIINEKSPFDLINWFVYYPTEITDRNRLKNIHRILQQIPQLSQAKKQGHTIPPKVLTDLCKSFLDVLQLPPNLIEVIHRFGPHDSLNLPSTFCPLEIDPSALENLKKFKERKNMPLPFSSIVKEEPPSPSPVPPVPFEEPLSIAKRLFPFKSAGRWEKADTLSFDETILLHYGIEPVEILSQPLDPLPYHSQSEIMKEFVEYLNRYFLGNMPHFIQKLDETGIITLIERAVQAGNLRAFKSHGYPAMINSFMRNEIALWMEVKKLTFPIRSVSDSKTTEKKGEISKEDILDYDLKRMDKDQLAKLMTRSAAAVIWKDPQLRTPQQVRKLPHFKKALAFVQEIIGKKEPFDEKTVEDWIRNLNPNYKPKK
ncbi:MAG: hypothetical protein HW387_107 [Parachlamydiales bacterium]|nr:hypothetical protein [Parachlamydiales bacterium]